MRKIVCRVMVTSKTERCTELPVRMCCSDRQLLESRKQSSSSRIGSQASHGSHTCGEICLLSVIYNKKESFLTRVGVLLGIERRLPTALPSFQLVSFLISSSLSRFLSLHREGGECHGAPIGSFVFVWLQAAYRR